uniref:CRIB domain-containing protein n=1 Tax=Schistosoma curassoni TaxID=6186 RepID=A0A183JTI1_9TREM
MRPHTTISSPQYIKTLKRGLIFFPSAVSSSRMHTSHIGHGSTGKMVPHSVTIQRDARRLQTKQCITRTLHRPVSIGNKDSV